MKFAVVLWVTILGLSGCAADPAPPEVEETEEIDLCEQAALHRAECVGDYVTPPVCEGGAEAAAQEILDTPCDEFEAQFTSSGKADGALCDWFGKGCTPDEPIFIGPSCEADADCVTGFCVEAHCFNGVTSPEFAETLDLFTGTTELTGSATHLLVDNVETRQVRRDMIEGAQSSIHFSAFIIEEDETGAEMVELFAAAVQRGVEARVIIDATTQYTFSNYDILTQLSEAGVEVLAFNPATEWLGLRTSIDMSVNDRLHEKILIADGKEVVMGGRNVGAEYLLPDKWRDTDVYVAGKGVEAIQRLFLKDWDRIAAWERASGCESQADWGFTCPTEDLAENPVYYPELEELGSARTRAIFSDPFYQETPLGYLTTVSLVRAARKSITIANSYFVPPQRLRRHLKAAAERGVDVRVLSNSLESTDAWWMYYASINYYKELISSGIRIFQYKGTETMHAKTMLIDDELAVVGSYNLDPRSAVDNSESMLLITDGEAVGELVEAMATDFAFSTEASPDLPLSEIIKAKGLRLTEPLL